MLSGIFHLRVQSLDMLLGQSGPLAKGRDSGVQPRVCVLKYDTTLVYLAKHMLATHTRHKRLGSLPKEVMREPIPAAEAICKHSVEIVRDF